MDEKSNTTSQIIYPLIAGVGLGMLFHAPYQVFIRALKPQELATGTSAFFLTRFTGATIGLVSSAFHSRSRDNRVKTSVHCRQWQAQYFMHVLWQVYPLI